MTFYHLIRRIGKQHVMTYIEIKWEKMHIKMTGSEPVIVASIVASLSSLAAQALARLRWRCVPDETGRCRCLSACSDVPLVHKEDRDELVVTEYEMGGRKVLLVTAKQE